jgi:XTP/dITP diphosphohydrolase
VEVYVATKNEGKLEELRAILGSHGWSPRVWPDYADVLEGDRSYAENAALKARALRRQLLDAGIDAPVIGDDSGLEVVALGGRPGVLSARYGGAGATWSLRRRTLLAELDATGSRERDARFVCALCFVDAGLVLTVERDVWGAIAAEERGEAGFSYDPIFYYPPLGKTFAELEAAQKNAVSHRAQAVSALVECWNAAPVASREKPNRP